MAGGLGLMICQWMLLYQDCKTCSAALIYWLFLCRRSQTSGEVLYLFKLSIILFVSLFLPSFHPHHPYPISLCFCFSVSLSLSHPPPPPPPTSLTLSLPPPPPPPPLSLSLSLSLILSVSVFDIALYDDIYVFSACNCNTNRPCNQLLEYCFNSFANNSCTLFHLFLLFYDL